MMKIITNSADENFLYKDFPEFSPITDTVREENKKRFFSGGVRINQGRYRTAKECEKYRADSLKRKLP